MNVVFNSSGSELTAAVEGRLDTLTAPEFEKQIFGQLDGVEALTIDLDKLEYISSAGLRSLILLSQEMEDRGELTVKNVRPAVMKVFSLTGLADDLNIV